MGVSINEAPKAISIVMTMVLIVLGTSFILFSIKEAFTTIQFRREAFEAQGIVIEIPTHLSKNNIITVEFETHSGEHVIGRFNVRQTQYDLGKKLTVYYLPENPKESMVRRQYIGSLSGTVFTLFLGFFWLAIGFEEFRQRKLTHPSST